MNEQGYSLKHCLQQQKIGNNPNVNQQGHSLKKKPTMIWHIHTMEQHTAVKNKNKNQRKIDMKRSPG